MSRRNVLWSYSDGAGDLAELLSPPNADQVVAALTATNAEDGVYLTLDAARDLRDALNRLLDVPAATAATGTAAALHAAQHLQLEAAARRISSGVEEQTDILARIAAEPDLNVPAMVGTMLGVQRHTVAALADLLSAITGER